MIDRGDRYTYAERLVQVKVLSRPDIEGLVRVLRDNGDVEKIHALWFDEANRKRAGLPEPAPKPKRVLRPRRSKEAERLRLEAERLAARDNVADSLSKYGT